MNFLPYFPLHANVVSLFGLTLLLGLVSGELIKKIYFLPKISGYIAIGFLVGPNMLNIVTPSLLAGSRIFVDISLGLILFELGRHLDFNWLRHDKGILLMSLTESILTFVGIFVLLYLFKIPVLYSALVASIAISTAPAVIMMVADDLEAKGPVTRRTFILTSLNNLISLIVFLSILPMTLAATWPQKIGSILYNFLGSIILGLLIFVMTLGLARLIGKRRENQFILFIGCVMFAIGFAGILNLSSMLVLFTFGLAARNFNYKNLLTEVDFGWVAKLFFILLFVITGVHLQIKGLLAATSIVLFFILIRGMSKSCGIWLFAGKSRLTTQQTWAICLALTPMAGLAVGMSNLILDVNPALGHHLMTILATVIAILNIIGPIATQMAFVKSGETKQQEV